MRAARSYARGPALAAALPFRFCAAVAAVAAVAALGVLGAACSGAPAPAARPARAGAAVAEPGGPSYLSPARWSYHPQPPAQASAWARLDDGGCLVLGEDGHRWIVGPRRGPAPAASPAGRAAGSAAPPCAGKGTVSHEPAPEEIVGIGRRSATAWLFFGESGTVYEAASPLGPFVRRTPAPAPLAKIVSAGQRLLAATRDGGVMRWDEANGLWKPSAVAPPPASPGRAPWVFDVAVGEGGRALALAVPESLFASEDGGATWTRAPVGPAGLHRVGVLPGGDLLAEGIFSSFAWDPRRAGAPFARVQVALPPPVELEVAVSHRPDAAAALSGRAVIAGDRYYEARRPEDPEAPWDIAAGALGEPLEVRRIGGSAGCGSVKLGASGRRVVAVCVRGEEEDAIVADVLRSDDAGARWATAGRLETPDVNGVGVAVSPEGAALITGVCKPRGAGGGRGGGGECQPGAPVLLRREGERGERVTIAVAAAPMLREAAALPAFSVDGRSAYFLGRRTKDLLLSIFVSHDGGESFSARALVRDERDLDASRKEQELDEDDPGAPGGMLLNMNDMSTLSPGEDGAVGILLMQGYALTIVTADEDGRVISIHPQPPRGGELGVVGRRALTLGLASEDAAQTPRPVQVLESLDGGGSWGEVPLAPKLAGDLFGESAAIACGLGGCLVGDSVARVGWGGQSGPGPAPGAQPERHERAARTPIVCELQPGSAWTRIEGAEAGTNGIPGANEAMRGRSVWSVLTRDARGGVAVVSAMLPESGAGEARIVTRPLFKPAPPPAGSRIATHVSLQMEGYAAARLRVPGAPRTPIPPNAPMRNVEIAWENWLEGTSGRATIPDAGVIELGDVKPAAGGLGAQPGPPGGAPSVGNDDYDPALLSVSLRGVFVRPHEAAQSPLTFFLEGAGRGAKPNQRSFAYPAWPAALGGRALEVRSDAVFADGRPVGVGMVRLGNGPVTTALLAHGGASQTPAGGWAFEAVTIAPPPGAPGLVAHSDWTYGGGVIGVTSLLVNPSQSRGWAVFQPFRGDGTLGPAQPLPTPFDLPDAPRPCSAAQRAATARLEAPMFLYKEAFFPGTIHVVLVTDSTGPGKQVQYAPLVTEGVVLHGDPAAPCVAAWEAHVLGRGPLGAILPGDLAQAWLFRALPRGQGSEAAVEARPMACRFDPATKVPDAVWSHPAMSRVVP